MIWSTPAASSIFVHATPAAPAPTITTETPCGRLPTTRSAFRNAARTTTAVPCWSSWNTGMSSSSRRRRSISKQRGAEMSSRLIPPKLGARRATVSTMSSASLQSRQIGTASTPPNSLKSTALPSITGIAAAGPMSPRPSTALPSVTTATVFATQVYSFTSDGSAAIASQTRATPGVYARDRSSLPFTGTVEAIVIFPPTCRSNTGSPACGFSGSGVGADATMTRTSPSGNL